MNMYVKLLRAFISETRPIDGRAFATLVGFILCSVLVVGQLHENIPSCVLSELCIVLHAFSNVYNSEVRERKFWPFLLKHKCVHN